MRRDEVRRLGEQRKGVHVKMLQLVEEAEKEERNLSADEQERYDKMVGEFEELFEREQRGTKLLGQELEVERTLSTPIEKRIGDDGDAPATYEQYRELRSGAPRNEQPEYRSAFWRYMSDANLSLEVEEMRALSKGTTTAGGYLVPVDMYNQIIRSLRFQGSFGSQATEIVTDSGEAINVPANTAHGVATWTAESVGFTASDETFAQVVLGAHKASTKIIVSEELLEDSAFSLDSFLATEFGERLGVLEETAYIMGDGSGKPQGILATDATANITLATAAAGSSTAFTYSALVTAIFTLPVQYRNNASWIVNDGSARNLYLMVDGQQRPLWSVNVSESGPDTFLGYPIYTHPDLPAPAISKISAVFGDWKRAYAVRRVSGIGLQRQNELHSDNGQVGFRAYERVDGKVILAAAAIALKHSAT